MPIKSESKTKKTVKLDVAKKVATPKKRAAKKCADKAACQCELTANSATSSAEKNAPSKLTRIIVKHNVGWGNQLYIRGTGAGLNWHKGVLMQCIGEDEWLWEQLVSSGGLKFKILVNDEIWNNDEDSAVEAGETVIFHPNF